MDTQTQSKGKEDKKQREEGTGAGHETPSLLHLHTSYLSSNCGVPRLMTPGA